MADLWGEPFLLELDSADRFSERAIRFGSFQVKTPASKSSALLCFVTLPDQYLLPVCFAMSSLVLNLPLWIPMMVMGNSDLIVMDISEAE